MVRGGVVKTTIQHARGAARGGQPQLIMRALRDYIISAIEQDDCDRFGSEVYEARIS